MGFCSQVQITAENKAFKMFDEVLKKHELAYTVRGGGNAEQEAPYVITLDWIKWYPDFDEVKDVDEVRRLLNTDDYNNKDGYGYKIVILNEDDSHEEYSNDKGDAHFFDVCIQCYIDNPFDV